MRRVHSLEKYEPLPMMSPTFAESVLKHNKKSTRLNFLSKYIDVALEELDTSRAMVGGDLSRFQTETDISVQDISPKLSNRLPRRNPRPKQITAPATLPNVESKFKMLLGVFTSFALMISMM